jgi:hypothetical protein
MSAVLGGVALLATGGAANAQTTGTAGAAPSVAPVITSPPPVPTSPGVLSANPQADPRYPGVLSASPQEATRFPGVASSNPPGVGAANPLVAPVVLPAGMPMTGDGSLEGPATETSDGQ